MTDVLVQSELGSDPDYGRRLAAENRRTNIFIFFTRFSSFRINAGTELVQIVREYSLLILNFLQSKIRAYCMRLV